MLLDSLFPEKMNLKSCTKLRKKKILLKKHKSQGYREYFQSVQSIKAVSGKHLKVMLKTEDDVGTRKLANLNLEPCGWCSGVRISGHHGGCVRIRNNEFGIYHFKTIAVIGFEIK